MLGRERKAGNEGERERERKGEEGRGRQRSRTAGVYAGGRGDCPCLLVFEQSPWKVLKSLGLTSPSRFKSGLRHQGFFLPFSFIVSLFDHLSSLEVPEGVILSPLFIYGGIVLGYGTFFPMGERAASFKIVVLDI